MRGHPPEIFDGQRKNTAKFIKEFGLWKICNMRNKGMLNPFNRVALALSYIKGVHVDDWVAQQIDKVFWKAYRNNTIQPNIPPIYADNDERLWLEFIDEFVDAFGDSAVEE